MHCRQKQNFLLFSFILTFLFCSLSLSAQVPARALEIPSQGISLRALVWQNFNTPRAVILLMHEEGASRGEFLSIGPWLALQGYTAVAIDLRYGQTSRGLKNETALRSRQLGLSWDLTTNKTDVINSLRFLHEHYPASSYILWGNSYSASLAISLAAEYPQLCSAIIALSPNRSGDLALRQEMQENIQRLHQSILLSGAQSDLKDLQNLFLLIPASSKKLFVPQYSRGNSGSSALWLQKTDSSEYRQAVLQFLDGLQ